METETSMDCQAARDRIPDVLRAEETPADLAAHLVACAACREELARLRGTFALATRAVESLSPSPASRERLSREMEALAMAWRRRASRRRRLWAAAAFLGPVLAVLAWFWLRGA